jgi:serine/threonine protein kinase
MTSELFSEIAEPSREADVYAVGIVVYEVTTGVHPFGHHMVKELLLRMTQTKFPPVIKSSPTP